MRENLKEENVTNTPIPRVAWLLVEKGADPNARDASGKTPLSVARAQLDHHPDISDGVKKSWEKCIKLLKKRGGKAS